MTGDVVINVIVAFIVSTPEINIFFTAWALTLAAVMLWVSTSGELWFKNDAGTATQIT